VANAGRDTTLLQCTAAPINIAAGCTDPDANLSTCQLTSGVGSYSGGYITFTPTASGTYTFVLKATDACGLTDYDTSVATVTLNQAPVANAGRDTALFQCTAAPISIAAGCTDPDGNLGTCALTSGTGTYSGGYITFTPTVSGAYTFVLKATDACGLTDYDTSVAHVTVNQPPVASAGRDTAMFQCVAAQICIPAGCTDVDDNSTGCELVSGEGTYDGTNICFTPATAGVHLFIVKATDACGATDYDTSAVTVTLNRTPVADAGNDTSVFLAAPTPISRAAGCTDPDGNLATCELISTPGSFDGSHITFTPTSAGTYTFIIKATDDCVDGAARAEGLTDYDTSIVTVRINEPPVANAGADQTLTCQTLGQPICWAAGCTDIDDNLANCELVSSVGTYSEGQICFSPTISGTYTFVLKATDGFGATDYDTSVISVRVTGEPLLMLDESDTTVFCIQTGAHQICVPFSYIAPGNNLKEITAVGTLPTTVTYEDGEGLFCFSPPIGGGSYSFDLTATDSCGLQGTASHLHDVILLDCDTTTCFTAQIEKTHNSLQGHYEFVDVTLTGVGGELGGYDFLISYDASALSAVEVLVGQMLEDCGWEYFTYRFGATGNCIGGCPSGLLHVVALAEISNGFHHPSCFGPVEGTPEQLFTIKFLVTNDRGYECQYSPVKFYWIDCGDNAISSIHGDTLSVDKRIFAYDGEMLWDELNDVLFPNYLRPFGTGADDECMVGFKYYPDRCIEFWYGGVDIICSDSIDARGDLNLNGIANEIADAVLYTQYFLIGIDAFPETSSRSREAAIAASDVNADGTPLTVGDLVYLIRIIVGDALPYSKLSPFAQDVSVHYDGTVMATEASANVGAVLMTFRTAEDVRVTNLTSMTLRQSAAAGELKVLLYDISAKSIGSGLRDLIRIEGHAELVSLEAADYNGNMLITKLGQVTLPTTFALGQNYPNPFNPETVIEFALPTAGDVSLSVYNVAGQLVKTLINGNMRAGYHQIRWDGRDASDRDVSSGVYFYKLDTNGFSETRKMLLVK